MNIKVDSLLLAKIHELESYIQASYPKKNLKINGFLKDLKNIEPNLSVLGLLNHLADMHKEGSTIQEVVQDVDKTKKVFSLAGDYVKTLEQDQAISDLSQEIHKIILSQLERALQLHKDEYDILTTKK